MDAFKDQLADIQLPFEPDDPKLPGNLWKLGALDKQLTASGERSLFRTRRRRLALTAPRQFTVVINTPIAGLYGIKLEATGRTRGGLPFRRETLRSARI